MGLEDSYEGPNLWSTPFQRYRRVVCEEGTKIGENLIHYGQIGIIDHFLDANGPDASLHLDVEIQGGTIGAQVAQGDSMASFYFRPRSVAISDKNVGEYAETRPKSSVRIVVLLGGEVVLLNRL